MTFPPRELTVDIRFVLFPADWAVLTERLENLADDIGFDYQVITD